MCVCWSLYLSIPSPLLSSPLISSHLIYGLGFVFYLLTFLLTYLLSFGFVRFTYRSHSVSFWFVLVLYRLDDGLCLYSDSDSSPFIFLSSGLSYLLPLRALSLIPSLILVLSSSSADGYWLLATPISPSPLAPLPLPSSLQTRKVLQNTNLVRLATFIVLVLILGRRLLVSLASPLPIHSLPFHPAPLSQRRGEVRRFEETGSRSALSYLDHIRGPRSARASINYPTFGLWSPASLRSLHLHLSNFALHRIAVHRLPSRAQTLKRSRLHQCTRRGPTSPTEVRAGCGGGSVRFVRWCTANVG